MDKLIQIGVIAVLVLAKESWPIPLPGVEIHQKQETASSFFPFPRLDADDTNHVIPNFRDIIPNFNNTLFENASPPTTTTENPLAKLLDKLYGNTNWRLLLDQSVGDLPISTTTIPLQAQTTERLGGTQFLQQGFYGKEMSGNLFSNLLTKEQGVQQTQNNPNKPSTSKYMDKVVGSQQHSSTDSPTEHVDTSKSQTEQWAVQMPMETGTPTLFMGGGGPSSGQVPSMTMRPPSMSITQKPPSGFGTFDPNRANSFSGGDQSQYLSGQTNNYNPSYNPGQTTNGQENIHPNSAFNNFITQTGSDPNNQRIPVAYDPDTFNERIMNGNSERMHQGYTSNGFAEETLYGKEQVGYRFSAYSDVKPQTYNANALNQALFDSSRHMQQQPMGPMFLPASRIQQPTQLTHRNVTHIAAHINVQGIEKVDTTPNIVPLAEQVAQATQRPPQTFNFIPGNLFPGQSIQMAGQQIAGVAQEASPPEFLRHIPLSTGSDAFNPNVINAAQNVYNPSALSWIRTRDTSNILNQEEETVEKSSTTIHATTTPSYGSTTDMISGVATLKKTNSTISPVIDQNHIAEAGTNTSGSITGAGFDPNVLNANQGQSKFVPGQISPALYGYMNNPYKQGETNGGLQNAFMPSNPDNHGTGGLQNAFMPSNPDNHGDGGGLQNAFMPSNPDSPGDGGAKMTFNIAQLLGMNTENSGNNSDSGYGQNTAAFNPNIINNMIKSPFSENSVNSTGDIGAIGMGFAGTGFDPNAANQGFGNLLGTTQGNQSAGYMGGYGGFDPNAANVGFGEGGFGMGGTGAGGGAGYMAAFDPNKVNQIAMHNPFEHGENDTDKTAMLGYFLGLSSGKGQGPSGTYSSPYISAFNPDSVNHASYDPGKFNQAQLHFDPLDMLTNNPGMDKDTLIAAASAFNPDRLNNPNMQQAFSPIEMLAANPGIDKGVLANLKYDPYAGTLVSSGKTGSASGTQQTGQHASSGGVFDPIALMEKLMQSAGAFRPGVAAKGQQSLHPSSMFGNMHGVPTQSIQPTVQSTVSASNQTFSSAQTLSHSSVSPTSSTPPPVSLSTVPMTTSVGLYNSTVV